MGTGARLPATTPLPPDDASRTAPSPAGPPEPPPSRRLASVDALRAVVMFTMLFVNDVAGVHAAPWWMRHYQPSTASGMTFVDLVFPAFLFLVGMSVPLALQGRLARGEPACRLVGHVVVRGLSLLVIGVFMVNMTANGKAMGWPENLWDVLAFGAVLLAFHSVPAKSLTGRRTSVAVRVAGFVALAYLGWVYRGRDGSRMTTSWYGILGLIGWAYVIAALLYMPLRRWRMSILAAAMALMGIWILDKHGWFAGLYIREWVNGSMVGSHAAIAMAGVALATTAAGPTAIPSLGQRLTFALGLITASVVAAGLLHAPYGINKNAATLSWCLWTVAVTTALWAAFHLLLDRHRDGRSSRRIAFLTHAGGNALLAYVLSSLAYRLMALTGLTSYAALGNSGLAVGIGRALLFATALLALCALLDRLRIRLKV